MARPRSRRPAAAEVSLYIDTSCLLKLLWPEPETARTEALVDAEELVVVSDLARLELLVQVRARRAAGLLTRRGDARLVQHADRLRRRLSHHL